MTDLFDKFIKTGLYLRGWSPKTSLIYKRAFTSFQQSLGSEPVQGPIAKAQLEARVICLRQRGVSPAGVNIYIRSMNSFCSWLKEEGVLTEIIKLKQLKAHTKPAQVLSEAEVKRFLQSKPKRHSYLRTWVMCALMLDTGCRIDEVLQLQKSAIDFDNLLLTVNGKGGKIRRIPFSADMRKPYGSTLRRSKSTFSALGQGLRCPTGTPTATSSCASRLAGSLGTTFTRTTLNTAHPPVVKVFSRRASGR
jgi:integrase/recombinase XerD